MAPDAHTRKRKKPPKDSRTPAKKAKVDDRIASSKPIDNGMKKTKEAVSASNVKRSRPKATDFFDDPKPQSKPANAKDARATFTTMTKAIPASMSRANTVMRSKNDTKLSETNGSDDIPFEGFSSDSELDPDQTAALLAGFDSESDTSSDEQEGVPLHKLPAPPKPSPADRKALSATKSKPQDDDEPGVLYIGRIPHGFYEHQMHAYFSQFGELTNLRIARNRRTGASKHYAFLEFASGAVADVVSRAMNKYLLDGHILQVRRIPQEQIHPELWKGSNKRFKRIPWRDIQARGLRVPREREVWKKRVERERERREARRKRVEEYGYDFVMGDVKGVDEVPSREERKRRKIGENEAKVLEDGSAANDNAVPNADEDAPRPIVENDAEGETKSKYKRTKSSKKGEGVAKAKKAKVDASGKAKATGKSKSKSK